MIILLIILTIVIIQSNNDNDNSNKVRSASWARTSRLARDWAASNYLNCISKGLSLVIVQRKLIALTLI